MENTKLSGWPQTFDTVFCNMCASVLHTAQWPLTSPPSSLCSGWADYEDGSSLMLHVCSPQDHDREKHAHTVLQFQFGEVKETLKQSEELLNVSTCPPVWTPVSQSGLEPHWFKRHVMKKGNTCSLLRLSPRGCSATFFLSTLCTWACTLLSLPLSLSLSPSQTCFPSPAV